MDSKWVERIPENFTKRERQLVFIVHGQHGKQRRKYSGEPYVTHLIEVARQVKEVTDNPALIAAALCHDLFEDTKCGEEELREKLAGIGFTQEQIPRIVELVWHLTDRFTKKAYPQFNRRERKKREAERLHSIPADAATIKLADINHNMQDIGTSDPQFAKLYFREINDFFPTLSKGDKMLFKRAKKTLEQYGKLFRKDG